MDAKDKVLKPLAWGFAWTLFFVGASVLTLWLWNSFAPPFQASSAVGQLSDDAATYAASRAAATFNPSTVVCAVVALALAFVWGRVAYKIWSAFKEE